MALKSEQTWLSSLTPVAKKMVISSFRALRVPSQKKHILAAQIRQKMSVCSGDVLLLKE